MLFHLSSSAWAKQLVSAKTDCILSWWSREPLANKAELVRGQLNLLFWSFISLIMSNTAWFALSRTRCTGVFPDNWTLHTCKLLKHFKMHKKTIFHSDRAIIVETHLHDTKVLLVSQWTSINHISQFENPQAHLRFQKQHETEFFYIFWRKYWARCSKRPVILN